jgi:hypothetical protein
MMKTSLKMSIATGLAALLVSFGASAEKTFNIGGDAEYDIFNTKDTATSGTVTKKTYEGGRVKLNAKARIDNENGSFVEAVVQPLFSFNDGKNNSTDDTYIKFGKKAWDVQLGRFEGFDLFATGRDAALRFADTSSTNMHYGANKARGRDDSSRVQGAAHFNVGKAQIELGGAYGDDATTKTTGIRPAVKFNSGRFSIAAGYDMLNKKTIASGATDKWEGFGLTAGTTVGKAAVAFDAAQGKHKTSGTVDDKITSYALYGQMNRFSLGYVHDKDKVGNTGKQDTVYAAYQVPLMGSKDATVTFAAGTSKAKYDAGTTAKNKTLGARFNYAF